MIIVEFRNYPFGWILVCKKGPFRLNDLKSNSFTVVYLQHFVPLHTILKLFEQLSSYKCKLSLSQLSSD